MEIHPMALKIIKEYLGEDANNEPHFSGMERNCTSTLKYMASEVFEEKCVRRILRLKGEPQRENEWDRKLDTYFDGSSIYSYSLWGKTHKSLDLKCQMYFEDHAEEILRVYIQDRWGDTEAAVEKTPCFLSLCTDFADWFDERREEFLENMTAAIAEIKKFQMSDKPQSHGGVANLLKVLTKTMEKQGADIGNIAKVQYAVCVQAGIYIPEEFLQDVAIALSITEKEEVDADKEKSETI